MLGPGGTGFECQAKGSQLNLVGSREPPEGSQLFRTPMKEGNLTEWRGRAKRRRERCGELLLKFRDFNKGRSGGREKRKEEQTL